MTREKGGPGCDPGSSTSISPPPPDGASRIVPRGAGVGHHRQTAIDELCRLTGCTCWRCVPLALPAVLGPVPAGAVLRFEPDGYVQWVLAVPYQRRRTR